jgi:hypothetical protein
MPVYFVRKVDYVSGGGMSKKKNNKELRKIAQPHYNYWQALYKSLYSGKLYIDVAKRWKGLGILYVFLLLALVAIPFSVRIIFDFQRYFYKEIIYPLEHLPRLDIQKGQVKFDKPTPYFIKNEKGKVIVIIDTSGEINSIDKKKYPSLSILVTKSELHVSIKQPQLFFSVDRSAMATDFKQSFSKDDNEVFVGKDWVKRSGMFNVKWIPVFLVYPILLMLFLVIYFSLFLMLAFLGQVFAKVFFDMKIHYKEACRIFSVAATAQIYLFFIMMTLGFLFKGLGLVYVAIMTAYFSYALVSIKRGSRKMVLS